MHTERYSHLIPVALTKTNAAPEKLMVRVGSVVNVAWRSSRVAQGLISHS